LSDAARSRSGAETLPQGGGSDEVPRHVAIIMDGNGRWAAARGLPRVEGHRRGVEALRRTVRWYVEHQPERGGDLEQRLQDSFDYDAEDQLAAIYREAQARAQQFRREIVPTPHPYPHPKEPGLERDHRNR
jgi:undecaprenyl pyrophosphate synthase